jgi:hypothetical protein
MSSQKYTIPDKFASVLSDFTNDLSITFPEYEYLWSKWRIVENIPESMLKTVYFHCLDVYPERFFDILYQNDDIFAEKSEVNTQFLPNVNFKLLFHCKNITENTKTAIWKYLQLMLFTVIGNLKDKSEFGKSMNLFEGIDESELQSKLTEAMSNMSDFFSKSASGDSGVGSSENDFFEKMNAEFASFANEASANESSKDSSAGAKDSSAGAKDSSKESSDKNQNIPNPEDMFNHLKGLFDGKLGGLAKELIEELTDDLKDTFDFKDMDDTANPKDIFKKMMRHPDKFMKIIKKVNEKFQDKMKRGDISQEDIMKEAGDMLKKMKEMGGDAKQMNEMFQNMAKSMGHGLNKNMKVDTNALNRMMKSQDIKDRLRSKVSQKQEQQKNFDLQQIDSNNMVYRPLGAEKAERSLKPPAPAALSEAEIKYNQMSIDELAASIEAVGESKPTSGSNKKNKGKKNK